MRPSASFRSYALLTLAPVLAGCSGGDPAGAPGSPREGGSTSGSSYQTSQPDTVVIDGSSTVVRISKAAQLGFSKVNDQVRVLLASRGTGGGFGRYLEGELDIVDASRAAKEEEESKAKDRKLDWCRFVVGYDGITVVANPENTFLKAFTVEHLKSLFAPGSKIETWKDLNPSWPARKISLYTPDNDSGTYEFFTEAVVGQKNAQRKDVQASSDDNTLVTGVAGDIDGLGYFGYAYFAANKQKLRAVPIQAGPDSEPVAPGPESILAGTYKPLSRPLYIYVKDASLRRPGVAAFVRYYLDEIDALAKRGGYVPPTAEDKAANARQLAERLGSPAATPTGE